MVSKIEINIHNIALLAGWYDQPNPTPPHPRIY